LGSFPKPVHSKKAHFPQKCSPKLGSFGKNGTAKLGSFGKKRRREIGFVWYERSAWAPRVGDGDPIVEIRKSDEAERYAAAPPI
jgi:hypothetical protein